MSEDIHNEDGYFKKAFRQLEEEPSPEVWEKISAGLDNIDAVYYRSKFIAWKRIACVLLILMGSAVTYQVLFTDKNHSASKVVHIKKTILPNNNAKQLSNDSSINFKRYKDFVSNQPS